jgi:hypothetical protein
MRTLTICAASLLLMCVGCGRPEHDSIHRRLGGAWIADGGLTRYVFECGIHRMIEPSGTPKLSYEIQEAEGDQAHIRVTLLRTGSGHGKCLRLCDRDQRIEAETELDGSRISGEWRPYRQLRSAPRRLAIRCRAPSPSRARLPQTRRHSRAGRLICGQSVPLATGRSVPRISSRGSAYMASVGVASCSPR